MSKKEAIKKHKKAFKKQVSKKRVEKKRFEKQKKVLRKRVCHKESLYKKIPKKKEGLPQIKKMKNNIRFAKKCCKTKKRKLLQKKRLPP